MLAKVLFTVAACLLAGSVTANDNHYLADRHVARGVSCQSCHTEKSPQAGATVNSLNCQICHGDIDKVAERTKAKHIDPDPHYNHLVGLDCQECHKGHKQSQNLCADCHSIQYKVP